MRALLAVDSAERRHLHTALVQRGWRVTPVATAEEAVARFESNPFPLVIVSHQLGGEDGVELCRRIRALAAGRPTYVMVVLPTSVPEAVRALAEAGIDDLLATPIAPSVLAMRLALAEYRVADHPGSHGEDWIATYPERKAQERALAESEARYRARSAELEEAMRARSRLYTTMNHELRTPISAIMLYQELLLSGVIGTLTSEQARAIEDSHASAEQLLDLVNDILDLSKIEAGKIGLRPVAVRVGEVLSELLPSVLPLARRFGSEVRVEIADDLPVLRTDPQRLRQILLNLASNAAKFGRGRPIVVRCVTAEHEVSIEVEDQGVGIASDELPRIFEDFVQVGTLAKGGTGLGLAISKRLAGLLQGRIEVESTLGVGSTFRLVLPAERTQDAARAAMAR